MTLRCSVLIAVCALLAFPAAASAHDALARRLRTVGRRQARAGRPLRSPSEQTDVRARRVERLGQREDRAHRLAAVQLGQAQGQRHGSAGHDRAHIVLRDGTHRQGEPAPVHADAHAPVGHRRAWTQGLDGRRALRAHLRGRPATALQAQAQPRAVDGRARQVHGRRRRSDDDRPGADRAAGACAAPLAARDASADRDGIPDADRHGHRDRDGDRDALGDRDPGPEPPVR